jgi:hypothetical protein
LRQLLFTPDLRLQALTKKRKRSNRYPVDAITWSATSSIRPLVVIGDLRHDPPAPRLDGTNVRNRIGGRRRNRIPGKCLRPDQKIDGSRRSFPSSAGSAIRRRPSCGVNTWRSWPRPAVKTRRSKTAGAQIHGFNICRRGHATFPAREAGGREGGPSGGRRGSPEGKASAP